MKAILLAGGKIAEDDLLRGTVTAEKKSLALIAGKPMVQWVADALSASDAVDELWISGLEAGDGIRSEKPVIYLDDKGGIFENIRFCANEIFNKSGKPELVFVVSGDVPGLQAHMVDWLAAQVEDDLYNIYYSTAGRDVIQNTFPESKRSFIHFKDGDVCGGDVNLINTDLFQHESDLWRQLTLSRKSPLRQAGMIGFDSLLLIALHAITLERAVKKICKKLDVRGKALRVPYAEMAMDVDKPYQFDMLEAYLTQRNRACA